MSDHERIWLQPDCCSDPDVGREWADAADPEPCEDGASWTEYVRADLFAAQVASLLAETDRASSELAGRLRAEGELADVKTLAEREREAQAARIAALEGALRLGRAYVDLALVEATIKGEHLPANRAKDVPDPRRGYCLREIIRLFLHCRVQTARLRPDDGRRNYPRHAAQSKRLSDRG